MPVPPKADPRREARRCRLEALRKPRASPSQTQGRPALQKCRDAALKAAALGLNLRTSETRVDELARRPALGAVRKSWAAGRHRL
jgi:hypothetical protein